MENTPWGTICEGFPQTILCLPFFWLDTSLFTEDRKGQRGRDHDRSSVANTTLIIEADMSIGWHPQTVTSNKRVAVSAKQAWSTTSHGEKLQ